MLHVVMFILPSGLAGLARTRMTLTVCLGRSFEVLHQQRTWGGQSCLHEVAFATFRHQPIEDDRHDVEFDLRLRRRTPCLTVDRRGSQRRWV
jgi:hypothetical protein